jgi:hypothetical protein
MHSNTPFRKKPKLSFLSTFVKHNTTVLDLGMSWHLRPLLLGRVSNKFRTPLNSIFLTSINQFVSVEFDHFIFNSYDVNVSKIGNTQKEFNCL